MPAYEVTLPTDPERRALCKVTPGDRRRWWQRRWWQRRKRWLPTFDADLLLTLMKRHCPGDALWIIPEDDGIPGGAYLHVNNSGPRRVYEVGLDMTLSASELSKALYHELEHCRQSRMFSSGAAFHTVAHYAAVEGILSDLGSWYEERATNEEDNHYTFPLVRRARETS